jgi:hypothetical protein
VFSTVTTRSAIVTGLTAGTYYKFYVKARNIIGQSTQSSEVTILAAKIPDAPISLANDPLTTTDTIIRFTWVDGAYNGGTSIIDYTVFYNQGTGSFT